MNLAETRLREQARMLKDRRISVKELLNEYLSIALKGSCITFCNDLAFDSAEKAERRRSTGKELSLIDGLPFSVKDNICTKDITTTCNSRSMKSNVPGFNATAVDNLFNMGAILTAKNCMREFSVGKIDDSAFELRNYINWAGTNKDINIGAFSIGTDIGACEFYCGLWTYKPYSHQDELSKGIITGSPTLEKMTVSARRADDLSFLYPFLSGKAADTEAQTSINPEKYKILVYDNLNMPEYIVNFLEECGFSVYSSSLPFLDSAELIYECILCAEFFTELLAVGTPEADTRGGAFFENAYLKNRIEGFGFEVKKLITTGTYLLLKKNKENTLRIIQSGKALADALYDILEQYDFIAAPVIYQDKLSKASAISSFPELIVPYGEVLQFKLVAAPENGRLLLDMAAFFEDRI